MKKLLILLLVILFVGCRPAAKRNNPIQQNRTFVKSLINKSVSIRVVFKCENIYKRTRGTGVIYRSYKKQNKSFIITAAHVVSPPYGCYLSRVYVDRYYFDNSKYPYSYSAIVKKINKNKDLVLLKVNSYFGVNTFLARRCHLGDRVHSVGFPVNLRDSRIIRLTYTKGNIAGMGYSNGLIRVTSTIYFGNSGGGLYNDNGELVGISVLLYRYDSHREYYAVGADYIRGFLSDK